ncbi:MAG: ATP-binding protein [Sulfuriferula sp.]
MKSIRQRLLLWLILGMLLSTGVAGLSMYWLAQDEANELFDYQIKQIALALPNHLNPANITNIDEDPEEDGVIQLWDEHGVLHFVSHPARALPHYSRAGLYTVTVQDRQWRIYGTYRHKQYVQVAQPMTAREELAAGLALRMLTPFAILIPLLAGLIWLVVGRSLRPLQTVTTAVAARHADAMQPLEEAGLPQEIQPMVIALNSLLARLNLALEGQRAFIADAAHELRSPLTALKLQLQLTERATTDAQRAVAFEKLHQRLDRSIHLVQQLLALARSEPRVEISVMHEVDLSELAQTAVQDFAVLARARDLILQLEILPQVRVMGVAADLLTLINNLLDNALRYTPEHGKVQLQVALEDGVPILRVIDTGTGIPIADRERVFDRFYRIMGTEATGSGLGLAIVRNIADAHHAHVQLEDNPLAMGLMVVVRFQNIGDATPLEGGI